MLDKIDGEIDLLERHLTVLNAVIVHGPIGIMKLTEVLHESQHRVRYSLRILEQTGYVQATPAGAVATEKAFAMLKPLNATLDALIEKLERLHVTK